MNVLYISYDGMTDPLGQSQVLPYLKGITTQESPFRIFLLSYEKPARYQKLGEEIRKSLAGYKIQWIPLQYTKNPPVLSSVFDVLRGMALVMQLTLSKKIKIVHCRGHYLTSIMAFFPVTVMGCKYIFDMRGFWADERIEGKLWDSSKPLYKLMYEFFKRLEKELIKRADQLITLTHTAKEYIEVRFPVRRPVEVIPCCADTLLFNYAGDESRNKTRAELGVEDKFALCYLGSLGTWYMLGEMLDFFKTFSEYNNEAVFIFFTHEDHDHIISEAAMRGVRKEQLLLLSLKREEVPRYLSACDASIFFITPVFSKSGSSPTKHGEVLGCGLPVVCNYGVGDVERIVNESQSGVVVRAFSDEEYRRAANELVTLGRRDRQIFRNAALKYYSLEDGIKKYKFIYTSLKESL